MRRLVPILLVLSLTLGAFALAGCSGGGCPGICQPNGPYEYVVCERCYPIDRNGNPIYREP